MGVLNIDFRAKQLVRGPVAPLLRAPEPETPTHETINQRMYSRFKVNEPKHYQLVSTKADWFNEAVSKRNGETWVDVYIFGCVHNSVKNPYKGKGVWNRPYPYAPNEETIQYIVDRLVSRGVKSVNLGRKTDPLMWMDTKYQCTLKMLEALQKAGIEYTIYTMSDLCAQYDYIELCKNKTVMRIAFMDNRVCKVKEPGAPSTKRRRDAAPKVNARIIQGWYA